MKQTLPRLLLCAPGSGSGKTTVTCALLQALLNRKLRPVAFKSGPDYIDPMFHTEVMATRSRNLDLFFLGEERVRNLLWTNGRTGDLAVIEGAMGYYDGIGMGEKASAYQLARTTGTPAVLVADMKGKALSAAATVAGMMALRQPSGIAGVILNRVSPMLYPRLKDCIERETGVKVYGFLLQKPECMVESRHLGLVTAGEIGDLREKLNKLAELAEEGLDLDGLLELARSAPPLEVPEEEKLPQIPGYPRIAVARDEAFCFYYADGLDLLERLGAELVPFSPVKDQTLPERIGGLYLGGGYPELYAKALSQNTSMREAVLKAVQAGLPTVAECGGFLYLQKTLADPEGRAWPMCNVFPSEGRNTGRLSRFGYVTLTAQRDGLLGPAGSAFPAHEFHYWDVDAPGSDFRAEKPRDGVTNTKPRQWDCGYHTTTLYAGFPHLHFCAMPQAAERFVRAAAAWRQTHNP